VGGVIYDVVDFYVDGEYQGSNGTYTGNPCRPDYGSIQGQSLGGQVAMLLHEVGHTLGLLPPDGKGTTSMGFPPNQSQLNTQTIIDHCLSAIRAALGGS
jgi:hypothetical protein